MGGGRAGGGHGEARALKAELHRELACWRTGHAARDRERRQATGVLVVEGAEGGILGFDPNGGAENDARAVGICLEARIDLTGGDEGEL